MARSGPSPRLARRFARSGGRPNASTEGHEVGGELFAGDPLQLAEALAHLIQRRLHDGRAEIRARGQSAESRDGLACKVVHTLVDRRTYLGRFSES
jgi:hypothetical protein